MWFDDGEISGRQLFGDKKRRKKPILQLHTRNKQPPREVATRTAVVVLVPLLIGFVLFLAWIGLRAVGQALFSENDRFKITRLDVLAATPRTKALMREYTQLREGMNIFAFDINHVRDYVMAHAAGFLSMTIRRQLPGTVVIEVMERTPLARVGSRGDLVADGEGWVFMPTSGMRELPVIRSYGSDKLAPASRADSMTLAALQVLEACDNPRLAMRVESIDADNAEYLTVRAAYGGRVRDLKLAWKGMRERSATAHDALLQRLEEWKRGMDKPEGQPRAAWDATFEGNIFSK